MKTLIIDGTEILLTRRRYGTSSWFCWASAKINGQWVGLGDPWPQITPKRAEIAESLKRVTAREAA